MRWDDHAVTDQPATRQDDVGPRKMYPRDQLDHESGQRPPLEPSPGDGVEHDGEPPDTEDDDIVPL